MSVHDETVDLMNENARLQSELAAARKALEESQDLLVMVHHIGAKPTLWLVEEVEKQIADQIACNRAALSSKEPEGDR